MLARFPPPRSCGSIAVIWPSKVAGARETVEFEERLLELDCSSAPGWPARLERVFQLVFLNLAVLGADRAHDWRARHQRLLADLALDLVAHVGVLAQEVLGILAALAHARLAEREE